MCECVCVCVCERERERERERGEEMAREKKKVEDYANVLPNLKNNQCSCTET